MARTPFPTQVAPVSTPQLKLDPPDLEQSAREEPGFRLSLLRWLAAVACDDGAVNWAEYQQLCALAEEGGSALEMLTLFKAIEHPQAPDAALERLRDAATDLPEGVRRQVLLLATPLLCLQGDRAPGLAKALAGAMRVAPSSAQLASCEAAVASPMLQASLLHPVRALKARSLRSVGTETLRMTGDVSMARAIDAYLEGSESLEDVQGRVRRVLTELASQHADIEQRLGQIATDAAAAQREVDAAEQLHKQVGQRLAMVEARIRADKERFEEDFEEAIHDAGNAVELEMLDRLKTDKWTAKQVWESLGKSTFAKELERRVDRLARSHERQLGLMKEDLRLFQDDFRLVQSRVLERTHHSRLGALMPGLRVGTRALNTVEGAADATLAGGVLAGLGTGAAVYALGTAAVLPVIAPVAPIAGGVLLVAGLVKWMMDSSSRMGGEVQDKRKAFEQALREQLSQMRQSYFAQLDQVGSEFLDSATVLVRPVLLDAHAGRELVALEQRVARGVLAHSRRTVDELLSQLPH